MNRSLVVILVVAAVLAVLLSQALFVVDQRQYALVFRFGQIVSIKTEPGLYVKTPLTDNVMYFDRRVLTIEATEPERFLTSEKKNVLVDLFIKWRIIDVQKYYINTNGDETSAQTKLQQTVNNYVRDEFGNRTVHDVVSGERDRIMELMRQKANEYAKPIGIEVLDVRLKRVDLPDEVTSTVYSRMNSERVRAAKELRSTGAAESEKIRADADKQSEIIVAKAYHEAQRIKGEGDAKAAATYAAAYQANPEFYAFYRSLDAYRAGLSGSNSIMVLDPNSEFFKYFRNSKPH